jgi:hypothetical protein
MIGPRVKAAGLRLSVFNPMPVSIFERHACLAKQRWMTRIGPVLALMRHRLSSEASLRRRRVAQPI